MHLDLNVDYPPGEVDELAVCYVLKSESMWSFDPVVDRSAAEHLLQEAIRRPDVHKVLVDGRPSAVAWLAKCMGDHWVEIKPTKGAEQYSRTYWRK